MATIDLSTDSGMKDFEKAVREQAIATAKQEALKRSYDVECPHCHSKLSVPVGKSLCPKCSKEINLDLDFKF